MLAEQFGDPGSQRVVLAVVTAGDDAADRVAPGPVRVVVEGATNVGGPDLRVGAGLGREGAGDPVEVEQLSGDLLDELGEQHAVGGTRLGLDDIGGRDDLPRGALGAEAVFDVGDQPGAGERVQLNPLARPFLRFAVVVPVGFTPGEPFERGR